MKATIRNEFHNTTAVVVVPESGILTRGQVKSVRGRLCGCVGCTCGGDLSERGPQDVDISVVGMYRDCSQVRIS